jgi:hypothetical protein
MSLVVAIAALVFTIASFWYIHLFPGKLSGIPPHLFAGHASASKGLLRLPIVIFNSGANAKAVTRMKLTLESGSEKDLMPPQAVRSRLEPREDDREDYFHAFVVPGRSVVTKYVDFQSVGAPRAMVAGKPARARLKIRVGESDEWDLLFDAELRTDTMANPESMITYSNDPAHWPKTQLERAAKALEAVRSQISDVAER